MSFPKQTFKDRDFLKFREADDGKTKVAITQDTNDTFKVAIDFIWDEVQATYPNSTQEVYTYKLSTVTVATITVNYTNSSKKLIQSVLKVVV